MRAINGISIQGAPRFFSERRACPAQRQTRLNMCRCIVCTKRESSGSPRRRANAHSVASRMLASSYSRARCRPRKQIDLPDLEVIGFEPATPTSRLPAEATTHPVPMRNSPSASLSVTLPPVIVCPLFTDESPHPVPPGPSVRCLIRASVLVTETVC